MRLFAAFLSVKGAQALDVNKVTMRFFRSLPVNDLEIAQTVQAYNGLVPQEALLTQVPFIEDAQAAAEEMRQEQQERAKMQAAAFSVPLSDDE